VEEDIVDANKLNVFIPFTIRRSVVMLASWSIFGIVLIDRATEAMLTESNSV